MRLQLALNVHDLDAAIDFYSKMFDTAPAKTRPGYANFAIADPPLKLVLFEAGGPDPEAGTVADFQHLNHLGVEAETVGEVVSAESRLADTGLATTGVEETQCCYAEKTETWLASPEGARWEWYVKTGDSEVLENTPVPAGVPGSSNPGTCCG